MRQSGFIPCKTHTEGRPVAFQVHAKVEGCRRHPLCLVIANMADMQAVRICVSADLGCKDQQNRVFRFALYYAVRQRVQFRLYPCRQADGKANSMLEIFGPKYMECADRLRYIFMKSIDSSLE